MKMTDEGSLLYVRDDFNVRSLLVVLSVALMAMVVM
jgi:hypothetical protein